MIFRVLYYIYRTKSLPSKTLLSWNRTDVAQRKEDAKKINVDVRKDCIDGTDKGKNEWMDKREREKERKKKKNRIRQKMKEGPSNNPVVWNEWHFHGWPGRLGQQQSCVGWYRPRGLTCLMWSGVKCLSWIGPIQERTQQCGWCSLVFLCRLTGAAESSTRPSVWAEFHHIVNLYCIFVTATSLEYTCIQMNLKMQI